MTLEGKRILVTGGTGSMGKTFVRRALSGELGTPKKVIVMSRDEAKQHYMRLDYLRMTSPTDEVIYKNFQNTLEFRIGDVRRYSDVCNSVKDADIVINAAALKQVPTCEYFPEQALLTNCQGAVNITRAIQEHSYSVETVLGVSTDKACHPVNVMGMTKAIQERIFISANIGSPKTRFICVRYGNVLASRGSVVPLFHDQISKGGPITLTSPDMTRFLLSLDQAVDTIFTALKHAKSGEIIVPIAPSANMKNLAQALIGTRPIKIQTIGTRPGEKMHEIMVSDEEAPRCRIIGSYYAIQPMLPELAGELTLTPVLNSEFSSGDNVLSLNETVALLQQNNLMVEQVQPTGTHEMLR
ncbi:MAG: polysaccharide biosynthesis protein [Bdellovibrionales bacterium]|nr:polysaccharide biosynthesis protein [Bdellovibrionales bacterium]